MEEKILMARIAERAERFGDMVDFLREIVILKNSDFTIEERNLLSVGFKSSVEQKRTAIRTIGAIKQNPKYSDYATPLASYKKKIEDELFSQCLIIIALLSHKCLKVSRSPDSKAFFLKMIGDYYRYVAESASGSQLEEVKQGALEYYNMAINISIKELDACDPIRLGLALNFSVFYFEVMSDCKKACKLGETALQNALEKIEDCDEETFKNANPLIKLLEENLSSWKKRDDDQNNLIDDL